MKITARLLFQWIFKDLLPLTALFLAGLIFLLWSTQTVFMLTPHLDRLTRFLSEQSGLEITCSQIALRVGDRFELLCDHLGVRLPENQLARSARSARSAQIIHAGGLLLRFSPKAWLRGHVIPLDVVLIQVTTELRRSREGLFFLGNYALKSQTTDSPDSPQWLIDFSLKDATLTFVDEQKGFKSVMEHLSAKMRFSNIRKSWRFQGEGILAIDTHDTHRMPFSLDGRGTSDFIGEFELQAKAVRTPLFRAYWSVDSPLNGLRLPLSATVHGRWGPRRPFVADWRLRGGSGDLNWPHMFRWPLPVKTVSAHGMMTRPDNSQSWNLRVDRFDFKNRHGHAEGGFAFTGVGGDDPALNLTVIAGGVSTEEARFYYPVTIMRPGLVEWLDTALEQGEILQTRIRIQGPLRKLFMAQQETLFRIESDIEQASVRFFRGVEPVSHARVRLVFDKLSMSAQVKNGHFSGSETVRGEVRIDDLVNQPVVAVQAHADVDLQSLWKRTVTAPALRWDRAIGWEGSDVTGAGMLSLTLHLPIWRHQETRYHGALVFDDGNFQVPFLDNPIHDSSGTLSFDQNHLRVVDLQGDFLDQRWNAMLTMQNYQDAQSTKMTLRVDGDLDVHRFKDEIDFLLGETGELRGTAPLHLIGTRNANEKKNHIKARLNGRNLTGSGRFGWKKLAGEAGEMALSATLDSRKTMDIEKITGQMGNLSLDGAGWWNLQNDTGWIQLNEIQLNDSIGKVRAERDTAWHVDAALTRLDLGDYFSKKKPVCQKPSSSPSPSPSPSKIKTSTIHLYLEVDQVHLANGEQGTDLNLRFSKTDRMLHLKSMTMRQGDGEQQGLMKVEGALHWTETPESGPYRGYLEVTTEDFGHLLRAVHWSDRMRSGKGLLSVTLSGDLPKGEALCQNWSGSGDIEIKEGGVRDFYLLSKLLGLLSIKDLPRLMTGDRPDLAENGFYYRLMDGSFQINRSIWKSDKLALVGPSMAIIISGTVDFPKDRLDLLVGIRPMQTVDALLNKVPILGRVITGKRKTLVETQLEVTGAIDEAEIRLKPASSLAPGILKDILEIPEQILEKLKTD